MWDSLTEFFDGAWDTATNSFQKWLDFDLQKTQMKAQSQQAAQQSPAYQAAAAWEGQTNIVGVNVPNLLLYAGLGVAGYVVLKKVL